MDKFLSFFMDKFLHVLPKESLRDQFWILFEDDASLFSVIHDVNTSASQLNDDLCQINKWTFQWKMSFNPDPSKQTQEISFSRKAKKIFHPSLRFINSIVLQTHYQKHLGIWK